MTKIKIFVGPINFTEKQVNDFLAQPSIKYVDLKVEVVPTVLASMKHYHTILIYTEGS